MIRSLLVTLHLTPTPLPTSLPADGLAALYRAEEAHVRIDAHERQVRQTSTYLREELARNHFGLALEQAFRRRG